MKKVVAVRLLFLGIFLLVFLSSFVSAVERGACNIVPKGQCTEDITNGYKILGLSAISNAHGQLLEQSPEYDFVLCCNIGGGDNTCQGANNKLVGFSSPTNAHAQIKSQTSYTNPVCYEDFSCLGTDDTCGTGEAVNYPLGILSLSGTTNAHISNYTGTGSYSATKICCGSPKITASTCTITSARWGIEEVMDEEIVYLEVTGSGAECQGQRVSFIIGGNYGDNPIDNPPISVSFNSSTLFGAWQAERQENAINTPATYYFDVFLDEKPNDKVRSDNPRLQVSEFEEEFYTYVSCEDYQDVNSCESDVANVGSVSNLPNVDCSEDDTVCGCVWDEADGCNFHHATITDPGTTEEDEGCNYGTTVCENETGTYCNIGSSCPAGEEPSSDDDGTCEWEEGCLSEDCLVGDPDTCAGGLYCIAGECSSVQNPLVFELPGISGSCKITQTIEKDCQEEPVGYRIVSWIGTWKGATGGAEAKCETGGKATIPCPSQVQLPFFDYFELMLSVLVIAVVYLSIVLKKKFRHGINKIKRK